MFYRLPIYLFSLLFTVTNLYAIPISNITVNSDTVGRYEKFEVSFDLASTYSNPYDPDIIDITAIFVTPSLKVQTCFGFWYQGYTGGTPVGSPSWKLRFAPSEIGDYQYQIIATDGLGTDSTSLLTFTSIPSNSAGFLTVSTTNRHYIIYNNGTVYNPLGYNVSFASIDNTASQYDSYFSRMSTYDMNWSRFWMTDFNQTALEWGSGHFSGYYNGIGNYSQQAAARNDLVIDKAKKYGIYIQLVFNDHGQFSTFVNGRWNSSGSNAYNSAAGGPVPQSDPIIFFGQDTAKNYFKKKLRYIVARWGYSTNILAWEFFNEVQFCGTSFNNSFRGSGSYAINTARPYINSWHSEMAAYLKQIDPWNHMITTSSEDDYGFADFSTIWGDPNIDMTQSHFYYYANTARDSRVVSITTSLMNTFNKPHIVGEFGLENNPENNFNPNTYSGSTQDRDHLKQGSTMHNVMWATALSESGAMLWWWDSYISVDSSRNRIPPDFPKDQLGKPLWEYLKNEDFPSYGLKNSKPTVSGPIAPFGLVSPSKGFFWVRDTANDFGTGAAPGDLANRTIFNVSMTISGFQANTIYNVIYYSPYGNGGPLGVSTTVNSNGTGSITINITPFQRDIAMKIVYASGPVIPLSLNLPDLKLFINHDLIPAFDLADYFIESTTTQYSVENNFLNLVTLNESTVNQADYSIATSGLNSYYAISSNTSYSITNKVKYSSYKINKLPGIGLNPGSTMNMNIMDFTNSDGAVLPPSSYGTQDSIIIGNPSIVTSYWSNDSILIISALSGFTINNPVNVDIIASPSATSPYGSDIDKERMWIYPNLLANSTFSTSNDTSFYGFELAPNLSTMANIGYSSFLNDSKGTSANGVITFTFPTSNSGIKTTPLLSNRILYQSGEWYNARMRIYSPDIHNSHQNLLFNFSNDAASGTGHVDVSGYVLFGTPTVWTWIESPLYSHETGLGYPQFQLKAGGVGSIAIDEIQIINATPTLIDSDRYITRLKYPYGDFDQSSDTTGWGQEIYPNAGAAPAINGSNGYLQLDFTGATTGAGQKGIKWTANNGLTGQVYTPSTPEGREIGAQMNITKDTGEFNTFAGVILMATLGVTSSGQFTLGSIPSDIIATAEFGRITDGLHRIVGKAVSPYHQFQFGLKNDQEAVLKIDYIDFLLDQDDPNYGDGELFP